MILSVPWTLFRRNRAPFPEIEAGGSAPARLMRTRVSGVGGGLPMVREICAFPGTTPVPAVFSLTLRVNCPVVPAAAAGTVTLTRTVLVTPVTPAGIVMTLGGSEPSDTIVAVHPPLPVIVGASVYLAS